MSQAKYRISSIFLNQVGHGAGGTGEGNVLNASVELRGVPDGTRDDTTGELVHDDLLVSAAMCYVLDGQAWGLAESEVIRGVDPLAGMGEVF